MRFILVAFAAVVLASTALGEGQLKSDLETVLVPAGDYQSAPHGQGNVYAPDILVEHGVYRMWFGGQGKDGHDRIQLAESQDGRTWRQRGVVLEDDSANHVNDPSVVRVGDQYFMYYTRAGVDVRDEIAVAASSDGVHWTKQGVALAPSPEGQWDSLLVGRPSVLVEDDLFRMWYDGRKDLPPGAPAAGVPKSPSSSRAVGYAESRDGLNWVRPQVQPVFTADAGGVHVSRIGNRYFMAYESHAGTLAAVSSDGCKWESRGLLCERSSGDADMYGHVTPFLLYDPAAPSGWLFVGAARGAAWDRNSIARVEISADKLRAMLQ